jgi:hypothetical protein
MASNINADNGVVSGSAGLKTSADSTGVLALQTNGTTAVTVDTSQNATFNSTGSLTLPTGTTGQRPSSPVNGMIRFNTTLGYNEWYSGPMSAWFPMYQSSAISANYLVVAGGGAGGGTGGGGGGAGGYLAGTTTLTSSTIYQVTVGAGGTANANTAGANGQNSVFGSITSVGGGGGGYAGQQGIAGGSGGGSGRDANTATGASATAGQGFAGGGSLSTCAAGGGGGGASQVGYKGGTDCGSARTGTLSQGGDGLLWIDSNYYAGGGGGAWESISVNLPPGGLGGGGRGGGRGIGAGVSGTANTGGGGGGTQDAYSPGNGGSGIVIIKYSGIPRATGGVITESGGITTHTFTASGTLTTNA